MKKLVNVSVFALAISMALYSCSNGPYDATPDEDNSAALNNTNPNNGVNVYLGTIEATINNKRMLFSPAYYYLDTSANPRYQFVALAFKDSIFHRKLRIIFNEKPLLDSVYTITADTLNPVFSMTMVDTTRVDKAGRPIYKTYTANTANGVGYGQIEFKGEEGGNFRGNLYGNLFRNQPEEKFSDSVEIKFSEFYFEKKSLPLPKGYEP